MLRGAGGTGRKSFLVEGAGLQDPSRRMALESELLEALIEED